MKLFILAKEGETIDKTLKTWKKKFEKAKIIKELRERQQYKKPSQKRRNKILKAIYRKKMKLKEE
jgi:small subunit ribosomal protein S21